MELLTIDDLSALVTQSTGPCVSVFMPTHRAGPDTRQDPIRLKNLLGQAEERLVASGLRSPHARDLLKPAQALLDDPAFWRHLSDGLALFAAPELFRTYRLPLDLREQLIVAQRLHVKPLLTLFMGDGHFFILALSQNQVRLLEATRYAVDELDLEGVPSSMAEALPSDRGEKQLQFQTRTRGGTGERAAVFHGHDPADEAKGQILRYFQRVDEGLREVLREEQAPLVLAGVDYLLPLYREANSYPHLLAEGITGSSETIKAADLHEQAWAIVEPHFAAAQHQALGDYAQKAGTGLTSNRVDEVVPAAYHGRVGLLWVALGAEVWGRYDPEAGIIDRRDEPVPGDEDLLDLAALQTILKGGTVYAVEPKAVPGSGSLAALFRY
jgi:hypothetical protein